MMTGPTVGKDGRPLHQAASEATRRAFFSNP